MARETRKSKRAPASLKVRFRAATVGEFIEQQTTNLSAGGIFIKSKNPLPRGTLMVFEFQLQDGAALIKGVGRVVWVRRTDSPSGEPPGMGIKFIRIDPESRETFESLMAAKDGGPADDADVVATLEPGMGQPAIAERPDPLATGQPVSTEVPQAKPPSEPPPPAESSKEGGEGAVLAKLELKKKDDTEEETPAGEEPADGPTLDELLPDEAASQDEVEAIRAWTPVPRPVSESVSAEPGLDESAPPSLELDADAVEEETPKEDDLPSPADEGSEPSLLPPPDLDGDGADMELAAPDDFAGLLDAAEVDEEETPPQPVADQGADDGAAEEAEEEQEGEAEAEEEEEAVAAAPVALGPITPDLEEEAPAKEPEPEPEPAPTASAPPEQPSRQSAPGPAAPAAEPAEPADAAHPKRSPATLVVVVILGLALLGATGYLVKLLMDRSTEEGGPSEGSNAVVVPPTAEADGGASAISEDGGGGQAETPDGGDAAAPGDAAASAQDSSSEMVFGPGDGDGDGASTDAGGASADAAAAPERGGRTLVIRSNPENTTVSINGTIVGRTPVTLTDGDLPLDQRLRVRLSRSGYDNWSATVLADDPRWTAGAEGMRIELDPDLNRHERRRRGSGSDDEGGGSGDEGGGSDDEGSAPEPAPATDDSPEE